MFYISEFKVLSVVESSHGKKVEVLQEATLNIRGFDKAGNSLIVQTFTKAHLKICC
jgi:sporulation protein YlmC with PRC-barrel domain